MPTRSRHVYRCSSCGHLAPTWSGRCSGCDAWNTLVEAQISPGRTSMESRSVREGGPRPLAAVDVASASPVRVGLDEFDRALSGGLVPGSVTLLSGPPGVGKSTLALQVAASLAAGSGSGPVLYVAAEETPAQVHRRAERLGVPLDDTLLVDDRRSLDAICDEIVARRPLGVVIDSIQTIADASLESGPGSLTQVRECAQRLAEVIRSAQAIGMLIGHVTKDGAVAGPRLLEHLVDTVLSFDADGADHLRLLRVTKHRFGPTDELGVFTMEHRGLVGVADAAGLFLHDRPTGMPGSVVVPIVDGRRTMLVEVQALVHTVDPGHGQRSCQGLDPKRVELVAAVLQRQTGISGSIFASIVGGLRTREPAVDLGVAVAVASAACGVAVDPTVVVCGEIGLTGELRRVPRLAQRLTDAARLGFRRAVVPAGAPLGDSAGLEIDAVESLADALDAALGVATPASIRSSRRPEARLPA